jgi:hypothetical protein
VAQSKAKKARAKLAREGKYNPEQNRLSWNGLEPSMRLTPTLTERKERLQHKHKWNRSLHSRDGSISLLLGVI